MGEDLYFEEIRRGGEKREPRNPNETSLPAFPSVLASEGYCHGSIFLDLDIGFIGIFL